MAARRWTTGRLLELSRTYRAACVLVAAAELDLFEALADGPSSAEEISARRELDLRGTTILLDALATLGLLRKRNHRYALTAGVRECLTSGGEGSVLAMLQHQANCLRRWSHLATVVKTGHPAPRQPSTRGEAADLAAFIGGMHDLARPLARELVGSLQPLEFNRLLDLGGASGTWTIAFLLAQPEATAALFDRPEVLPMARARLAEAGLADRVELFGGDFMADPLPPGADLAWVSAIVHQNSREQNRRLFTALHAALNPGGTILIRDVVMQEDRLSPAEGALFAVNMLVSTEGGGTFTFAELREDLEAAGFVEVVLRRPDEGMNSIVQAVRPQTPQSVAAS